MRFPQFIEKRNRKTNKQKAKNPCMYMDSRQISQHGQLAGTEE